MNINKKILCWASLLTLLTAYVLPSRLSDEGAFLYGYPFGYFEIGKDYIFQELVNPIYNRKENQVTVSLAVKYLDQQTKATQVSQFDLVLEKNGSNWKIIE